MVHRAFAETGTPPLLWQFQFQLAPRVPLSEIDFPRLAETGEDKADFDVDDDDTMENNWEESAGVGLAALSTAAARDIAVPADEWDEVVENEGTSARAEEAYGRTPFFTAQAVRGLNAGFRWPGSSAEN